MTIESGRDANASGDVLWTQDIYAKDGSARLLVGQIKALADAAVTDVGKASCRLEFWTATSTGALTKALTIDSAQASTFVGNIGGVNLSGSGLFKLSGVETGLTAHAGGTQGAALGLSATKSIHNVTIVGSANDSVVLPASTGGGTVHWIKNSAAANSLQLFGLSADTIDGVTAATGVAVASGKSRIVLDFALGTWLSILGA
jgi:hypothetical protein